MSICCITLPQLKRLRLTTARTVTEKENSEHGVILKKTPRRPYRNRPMPSLIRYFLHTCSPAFAALFFTCLQAQAVPPVTAQSSIDREAVVNRHPIHNHTFDPLNSLSVGNGAFAFTVDATGLQSFPDAYESGVSLGTQSEWGWHAAANTENYRREETYKMYTLGDREVPYAVQGLPTERQRAAADFFRKNPHRLHLGLVGFEFELASGETAHMRDILDIDQTLDLWNGIIRSRFSVEGQPVEVLTVCDPDSDRIAVQVRSVFVSSGRLRVVLRFPYPSMNHTDSGCNLDPENDEKHLSTVVSTSSDRATMFHQLDACDTYTTLVWQQSAKVSTDSARAHQFVLQPCDPNGEEFAFSCTFSKSQESPVEEDFVSIRERTAAAWHHYWQTGGFVDFGAVNDPRAAELERRVVLSQYLERIQCAGTLPPQETGLTFNSWFGKFHIEMHWWHGAHWPLWGRSELLRKALHWYTEVLEGARSKAKLQGYAGARWPKMTDPSGADSPSGVGEFLIWQQPHILYFAEQMYRDNPSRETLETYADLVFATADFMADVATWNEVDQQYDLGPPLIPAQERLPRETTVNPPFELRYWRYGLDIAQKWRTRLELEPDSHYQTVLDKLAPLGVRDGVYLAATSAPDSYTNPLYMGDHPMVLGAIGMLPIDSSIDLTTAEATYRQVETCWDWPSTWGWDYPMLAMAATRLGFRDKAVDALLMDVQKNTYLANGHNYQDERLRIYLPGNGGLLSAVAMMCAGFEGNTVPNPGFPADWEVRWEKLSPMP